MFRLLSRGKLSVLLFHKVPQVASPLTPHEIDLQAFTRVIEAVQSMFRVIPLADAVTALRAGKLPPRAACITFDDGYQDWAAGIVPTLQRLQAHATFFITTGQFHGQAIWSERILHAVANAPVGLPELVLDAVGLPPLRLQSDDDRRAAIAVLERRLKYLPLAAREDALVQLEARCGTSANAVQVMPLADLRMLHGAGFGIGSHTVAHPILTHCQPDAAFREMAEGREQLEALIGGRVEGFAYPNGIPGKDFDASHVAMVQRAGYRYAVTTHWGTATQDHPVFQIPRFTPWGPTFTKMAGQLARNLVRRTNVLDDHDPQPRRALMVAFHFPPQAGSSGVLRTANFVKNLPGLGWRPDVLTAQPLAYEETRTDLIDTIPSTTRVLRAAGLDAARHLSLRGKYPLFLALPDRWSSWWLPAVLKGLRQLRRERTDLIWSTYPLATAHLIGATLARITRLPWVADFRDPMVSANHPQERLKRRFWERLERHVLTHAQLCVFTTERAAADYRKRYPQAAARCVVVQNGYDDDVFVGVHADRQGVGPDKLLLLHSGLIYPKDRDPGHFFGAVAALLQQGHLQRDRLLIRFRAPTHGNEVMRVAAAHGLEALVEIAGPLPHAQAIAEMLGADLLLLFQGSGFNAQIPAKIYEYLRAQRPMLAVVDRQGDTAALAAQFQQVFIAAIDSQAENQAALQQWLQGRGDDARADFSANLARLAMSSRAYHAKLLAQHLELIAAQTSSIGGAS
jgi:peptidoglycan/xylan/chitin deacetylase (PgdA/CDA1 family)